MLISKAFVPAHLLLSTWSRPRFQSLMKDRVSCPCLSVENAAPDRIGLPHPATSITYHHSRLASLCASSDRTPSLSETSCAFRPPPLCFRSKTKVFYLVLVPSCLFPGLPRRLKGIPSEQGQKARTRLRERCFLFPSPSRGYWGQPDERRSHTRKLSTAPSERRPCMGVWLLFISLSPDLSEC